MSIGGRVAYTRDLGPSIEVVTWEEDSPHAEYTAIRVEKNILIKRYMQPGDIVWWQGRKAFWTPKNRSLPDGDGIWHPAEEVELAKIANSYAVSPETGEALRGP